MSGGGGGSQNVTQEFKPPGYTTDGSAGGSWQSYLANANKISQTPYQQSGIAQVAPINDYQNTAYQLQYDKALYGTPMSNAANGAFTNAAQGNYANPYAQNVMGLASGQGFNPAMQGYAQIAAGKDNPYMSDQYTNNLIDRTANTMSQGFANGTASQDMATAAQAGAFGGSADQQVRDGHAAALSQQIGNMSAQTLAQQQQFKAGQYQQGIQNQLQGLGGYSNAYMGDVGNQLAANGQAGGMWQSDIGNILSGGALGLQGANAYSGDIQGLAGAGNNMNTYYQQLLNSYNGQFDKQSMYDATMNDLFGNALSRASGSGNSTTTSGAGQSLLSQLGGLGLTGAGIYSMLK